MLMGLLTCAALSAVVTGLTRHLAPVEALCAPVVRTPPIP